MESWIVWLINYVKRLRQSSRENVAEVLVLYIQDFKFIKRLFFLHFCFGMLFSFDKRQREELLTGVTLFLILISRVADVVQFCSAVDSVRTRRLVMESLLSRAAQKWVYDVLNKVSSDHPRTISASPSCLKAKYNTKIGCITSFSTTCACFTFAKNLFPSLPRTRFALWEKSRANSSGIV